MGCHSPPLPPPPPPPFSSSPSPSAILNPSDPSALSPPSKSPAPPSPSSNPSPPPPPPPTRRRRRRRRGSHRRHLPRRRALPLLPPRPPRPLPRRLLPLRVPLLRPPPLPPHSSSSPPTPLLATSPRHRPLRPSRPPRRRPPHLPLPPRPPSLNALLFACILSRNHDRVPRLFRDLPASHGINPNLDTYNTVLKSFSESGTSRSFFSVLDEMSRAKIKPNRTTFYTALAGFYKEERGEWTTTSNHGRSGARARRAEARPPGGFVEVHRKPVAAAEVMARNNKALNCRPRVFQNPRLVLRPDALLNTGDVFYIVPNRTLYRLLRTSKSVVKY
uniref:Pentatricopeptide repeat-containing protein n=1 Tax=Ananas comosus var. bracteatus TaxID=296719 RepID=A0A6V7QDY4_ANACO|nr:unnamed protein product [Ananas comosus var. bracteatus]